MGVPDASDSRLALLTRWVFDDLGFAGSDIAPASADASFRRYFRVTRAAGTYIVMDAPPGKEDLAPFLQVGKILAEVGLNVPVVLARDTARGLLLLSDLGNRQYLDELTGGAEQRLYADALLALRRLQTADASLASELPRYSRELLLREMQLMPEWFFKRHLGLALEPPQQAMLDALFETLIESALEQPASIVHRDYHSRNLLVTAAHNPGVLDFQDAVWGPVTYDLVSLLKDCYIAWPPARVRGWVLAYRRDLQQAGFAMGGDEQDFLRWFDLIGLQRHIKVLGIFSRLYYRDGKPQYLKDLPRVLRYVMDAAAAYAPMAEFSEFLRETVEPYFLRAQRAVAS
jgi:hypothetical protein